MHCERTVNNDLKETVNGSYDTFILQIEEKKRPHFPRVNCLISPSVLSTTTNCSCIGSGSEGGGSHAPPPC